MEESGVPSSSPSKPRVLNLDLLLGPRATVQTSVGAVYLYSLRASSIGEFGKLKADGPAEYVREFLPCIASLSEISSFEDKHEPLPSELAARLTEADLDALATAYALTSVLGAIPADSNEGSDLQRQVGETGAAYLSRILENEMKEQAGKLTRVQERILAPSSSIFDQVRKSSSALGSTLTEFGRLTKGSVPVEIHRLNTDRLSAISGDLARKERERGEELEMVRLTGKMTAESAKTLKDLAEAAMVLLQQLDERDKRADKSTRTQINIAVWSVGVSAILALFALIFSGLAYFQDGSNNESGDQWQVELLSTIRDENLRRAASEREGQRLSDQVTALEAKIARIEMARRSELPSKGDASASVRSISPETTILQPRLAKPIR